MNGEIPKAKKRSSHLQPAEHTVTCQKKRKMMESLERRHRVEPQWSTTRLLVEVFVLPDWSTRHHSMPKIHRCANGLVSPLPKLGRDQKWILIHMSVPADAISITVQVCGLPHLPVPRMCSPSTGPQSHFSVRIVRHWNDPIMIAPWNDTPNSNNEP
jgi:hypothetical protein